MPAFLDTNILIHHMTGEDQVKAVRCRQLLSLAENREVDLISSDLVIAEVVWVLQSKSNVSRERIRELMLPVVILPGLRLPNKNAWPDILDLFCDKPIDFIDAYNAVIMQRSGVTQIYSYDRDFDRFDTNERLEP